MTETQLIALRISSRRRRFVRCGITWTREVREVRAERFTAAQIALLLASKPSELLVEAVFSMEEPPSTLPFPARADADLLAPSAPVPEPSVAAVPTPAAEVDTDFGEELALPPRQPVDDATLEQYAAGYVPRDDGPTVEEFLGGAPRPRIKSTPPLPALPPASPSPPSDAPSHGRRRRKV